MIKEEFEDFLKENYNKLTNKEISDITGKPVELVRSKLSYLGLKRNKMQELILLEGEIFKDISELNNKYQISNKGRVKNNYNQIIKDFDSNGYRRITLSISKNEKKKFFIHRLVASAFLENPNNYEFVDHIDMNKSNNCSYNLEWVTRSENEKRKLQKRPELKTHLSKLNSKNSNIRSEIENQIISICIDIKSKKYTVSEIANKYNISTKRVSAIKNKRLWKNISKEYL